MALNTSNIILHFTEMQKEIVIDVKNIINQSFPSFEDRVFKTTLMIKSINSKKNIQDSKTKKCIDFLYNNKFRINGQQIIKNTEYKENGFDVDSIKQFIINNSTSDGVVYQDLGSIYVLSFDTFNDIIDFTFNIEIIVYNYNNDNNKDFIKYIINSDIYISNYYCDQYKFFGKQAKMINSNIESFMLLRTNPKLTGNIKLIVDSNNKLYLDTFKVSSTSVLNKKEYRHLEISADGDYPYDVYKIFGSVSSSELYDIYPDSYDPHKNYFNLNDQIENIYEYGAEYNTDRLYPENMHILAPLYIGKHLPDYFIIFRTDRLITSDYINTNSNEFKQMLLDAKQIKIFDLRKSSTIGKYLYNYHKQISKFLAGTCNLLFIELDNNEFLYSKYDIETNSYTKVPNENYRNGVNTWKGIIYNKGILSEKSETSYFANKIINDKNPQENLNMFLLNGYQRNNLLFPNIINLDFMFNDEDASNLSIHNYFGLYLTENNFITFNLIVSDSIDNKICYFDENNNEVNLLDTKLDILNNNEYSDRIFFINTINNASYIKNMDDVNHFIKDNVINKPYENILSLKSQLIKNKENEKSFISFILTNEINVGEHIRFIILNNYDKVNKEHIVLELIASDDKRLLSCDNYVFPYIQTNTPEYISVSNDQNYTKIYSLTFYANDLLDNEKLASKTEQIKRICNAILKFDSFIKVSSFNDESISFISLYPNTYCQHILSDIVETNKTNYVDTITASFITVNTDNVNDHYVINDLSGKNGYIKYDIDLTIDSSDNCIKFIDSNSYISATSIDGIFNNISVDFDSSDGEDDIIYVYSGNINEDNFYDSTNILGELTINLPSLEIKRTCYDNIIIKGADNVKVLNISFNFLKSEFENITVEDHIRYFNYNNLSNCYIIENNPDLYSSDDLSFSLFGYEGHGKRYSNIIKFINFDEYENNYIYEIYKDIYDDVKNIQYPIIATSNGYFPLIKYYIHEDHIEFSRFILDSKLIETIDIFNSVISPWDVNCSIIISKYESISNNNMINICSPLLSNIAIMGINQIKDIDTYTNVQKTIEHKTDIYAQFSSGERVLLNNSDPRLHLFTAYKLKNGGFNGIPNGNVIFLLTPSSIIYSNDDTTEKPYNIIELNKNYIEFTSDTIIELQDLDKLEIYNYTTELPVMDVINYFINPSDSSNSNLYIPLVPMINCQWKSTGVYFDNNSLLDVNTLNASYKLNGNFIENVYTPSGDINNQYIINNINDIINYSSELIMTIKNLLLSNTYKGFIKKYLISNYKIDTAIAHYTPSVLTLDFIYYGILFKIKLTNVLYKNDIKLNEFDNYEIYVINNYDGSLKNEMFINMDDEFILLINHTYSINDLYNNDCIKLFNTNNIENAKYDWYQGPYTYDLTNFAVLNNNAYLYKNNSLKLTSTNTKYLIELDIPDDTINSNDDPIYTYFNIASNKSKFNTFYNYDMISSLNELYMMISQKKNNDNYVYTSDILSNIVSLYTNNTQKQYDYRLHKMFMVKYPTTPYNSYVTQYSNDIKLDLYMKTFMLADMSIYIMNGLEEYKEFVINESYKPINFILSRPNQIKFNLGLFNPNFIDVFNFNIYDKIQDEIGIDTLYGNTSIKSINSIPNYYQNKILDIECQSVFNYFNESYRSPLSTCWDNNIYRIYSDDTTYKYIPGYTTGIQDKTFFGSLCLVLHDDTIVLDKWNYEINDNYANIELNENNINTEVQLSYIITLNITKTFYNYIINSDFYNNWSLIKNSINIKTYINNYIHNTLLYFYNFRSNIEVELYKMYTPLKNGQLKNVLLDQSIVNNVEITDSTAFIKSKPNDIDKYTLENNIKTTFSEVNEEIILEISISNYTNYLYYPIVKISKY